MAYCSQCAKYEAEIARLKDERDAYEQMARAAMNLSREMHPPRKREIDHVMGVPYVVGSLINR